MTKTVRLFICLTISLAAAFATVREADAWTSKTHQKIALIAIDYFPTEIRGAIGSHKDAYLKGVNDGEELYEKALEEKMGVSVDLLRYRGLEQYAYHTQRISEMLDKKTDDAVQAYEIGLLAHIIPDLLEPFPSKEKFQPLEIASHRIFFINDAEKSLDKFHFMFDGNDFIQSLPKRLNKDIDAINVKGDNIYSAYEKGSGFDSIEGDADAAVNRALNFLTDTVYTLYENRKNIHGSPFDPSQALGLDRFRQTSKSKEMKIAGPEAPKPPESPATPEKSRNNGKENSPKENEEE